MKYLLILLLTVSPALTAKEETPPSTCVVGYNFKNIRPAFGKLLPKPKGAQ